MVRSTVFANLISVQLPNLRFFNPQILRQQPKKILCVRHGWKGIELVAQCLFRFCDPVEIIALLQEPNPQRERLGRHIPIGEGSEGRFVFLFLFLFKGGTGNGIYRFGNQPVAAKGIFKGNVASFDFGEPYSFSSSNSIAVVFIICSPRSLIIGNYLVIIK